MYLRKLRKSLPKLTRIPINYWQKNKIHKFICVVIITVLLVFIAMWSIGQWYIYTQRNIPLTYGVTFIPDYAQSLGVNPQKTMNALIRIGVRQFRLTS